MFQFLLVFLSVVSLLGIDINMVAAPQCTSRRRLSHSSAASYCEISM
jgi:hypothetical protein